METYLVYLAARVFLGLLRWLPRPVATRLLDWLSLITYYVDIPHRHIAKVNLTIAFPELSPRERARIARKSFQNTARNLLEVSRLHVLSPANVASIVQYDLDSGLNNFLAARRKGKTILYLTGHFSAWELLPAAHALYGYSLSFVTRPLDNLHLERYLLKLREAPGNRVIPKKNSARRILEKLKEGEDVGLLVDQNTSLQEGVFADFFGVPAATTTSLALFALRTNAVVLPGYLTPLENDRYAIKFKPALELVRTGDTNRDIEENTRLFNQVVEEIIREQPESWLWGHKRWKNQPTGNPQDLYGLSLEELRQFVAQARNRQQNSVATTA